MTKIYAARKLLLFNIKCIFGIFVMIDMIS